MKTPGFIYNTIKVPHRYDVQGSDTTMLTREPSARTIKFIGILPVDSQRRYVVFAAVDRPNENRGKAFGSNVAAPIVK